VPAASTGLTGRIRGHRNLVNALAAATCAALLGYAYYTQFHQGLEPCPLCIFQRVAIAALGVSFVLAALLPPGWVWLGRIATALIAITALSAVGVAARHLYIQSLPEGAVPTCGATLDYMLDVFPVADVLRKVLTGSGECARITWRFLGLSMPGWVLIWALALGWLGIVANGRSRSR
jgi:protein dithiol:quinone oxidoreductase